MSDAKWTPERDQYVLTHVGSKSFVQIARDLSDDENVFTRHMVRGRVLTLRRAAENDMPPPEADGDESPKVKFSGDGDGNTMHCVFYADIEEAISNPEELMERAGVKYDKTVWEIERFNIGAWTTPIKTASTKVSNVRWENEVTVHQNYQCRVTLKRRSPVDPMAIKDALIAEMKEFAPVYPLIVRKTPVDVADHMLEICIFDLHFGKYAWGPETGTNYDIKIAEQAFMATLTDLLEKTSRYDVSHILFPVGNDLLHTDNNSAETTRGTRQDVDTRIKHLLVRCRQMLVRAIDMMREVAPVVIKVVPGNHDNLLAFTIGDSLDCWYNKASDVEVDNSPAPRKYHHWQKVLLGFTHGDRKVETQRLPMLMPMEQPEAWAASRFREYHVGHIHKRTSHKFVAADADNGVVVRTMDSLSGTDAWHSEQGYLSGIRAANAIVWHGERGAVGEFISHAPEELYASV